jgi:hypothetical protein
LSQRFSALNIAGLRSQRVKVLGEHLSKESITSHHTEGTQKLQTVILLKIIAKDQALELDNILVVEN